MPEQHRHQANKHEDIVNLQGAEAYRGGRPPTACFYYFAGINMACDKMRSGAESER